MQGAIAEEQKPAMRDTVFGGDTQYMPLKFMGQQCRLEAFMYQVKK